MSTVPLLMMSRRSTAHSVVCWVLRCTVSSPAAFSTWPWTEVGSLAISGATSHTPDRSDELQRKPTMCGLALEL
ncbi:hypothetical protein EYF80_018479 [Liparis tanakae]|uniref:Uncharacterized protein n=1 Tax=Liparis tanakae TaxID=230148 RepID=A0A4Z2HZY7_9TELE|nr:hypothetical protein EYF80_018479 [Liparis tanakae]